MVVTPQTVNAHYHPSLNEIVFPADFQADDAVNFGAMGSVVGHEMSHGFDDRAANTTSKGTWWIGGRRRMPKSTRNVEVMVNQANAYSVHGQHVQGKLTCGENIADLGGQRLALRALKSKPSFSENLVIDGFTTTQRFFLGWAQCWRQNITEERSLQLLTLDPHGPNPMRCNGPLSNIPEFHEAKFRWRRQCTRNQRIALIFGNFANKIWFEISNAFLMGVDASLLQEKSLAVSVVAARSFV